ncbi:MAG: glutathione peroxidase [Chitinophagales bacterium]|nr:glutathione peroxidase [Chitinophagales bacterium]
MANGKKIYDFKLDEISGEVIDFANFKNKNILIVNTASACGYTSQYEQLQALSDEFKDDLIVVGVPSNDFGQQEPGDENEIRAFCTTNFHIDFPLSRKTKVSGEEVHPMFEWLVDQPANNIGEISWNFHKFFIGKDGELLAHFSSATDPYSDAILDLIH